MTEHRRKNARGMEQLIVCELTWLDGSLCFINVTRDDAVEAIYRDGSQGYTVVVLRCGFKLFVREEPTTILDLIEEAREE